MAADEVRRLTGFDRVLVYNFDPDWHGHVIAESRDEELSSYLDLWFPASDIPAQARELYREGNLWGLILLHHKTARHVPFETRVACDLPRAGTFDPELKQ